MIPVQGVAGQTIAVLGLGRSGLATARALVAGGATPVVWDDSEPARVAAETEGFTLRDLTRDKSWQGVSLLVTSPGIPHLYPSAHPAIRASWAAGVPVDNDIGLFFRSVATAAWDGFDQRPRVVAVTGTNGKSTTSALIHHILVESGHPAQLGGNIGRGVLDLDPVRSGEVVVLELSSYQTELARALTPDIAVFTNLSSDHLDRHGGMGGYFAAKRRLFAEGGPDRAVIGVDEDEGRFLMNQLALGPGDDRVIAVSVTGRPEGSAWSVTARKGFLSEWRHGRQVGAIDLRAIPGLPGDHNHQNACAAYAATRSLGLGPRAIEAALQSYPGLPHRSQRIALVGDVAYVNDSKATNPDSAAMALAAFDRIRWICGGLQKEGGLDALHPHLARVRKAYVIGREAAGFARQLPGIETEICTTMARAVERAMAEAEPGDTVLLAPACASFDQYDNFERRGEDFVAEVRRRLP
jgi:UDP-N-acetylmuramoylalanine--D-glutamate ligase